MKRIASAAAFGVTRALTGTRLTRRVRASFPNALRTPACYPEDTKAIHLH